MTRAIDRLTLYFPQECLETENAYLTITKVENKKKNRVSRTLGNVNFTDYWFSIVEDFIQQDMTHVSQHIILLSDDENQLDEYIKKGDWLGIVFVKIDTTQKNNIEKIKENLQKCCKKSMFFDTFGNADIIFIYSAITKEEANKISNEIKEIKISKKGNETPFFSLYVISGECTEIKHKCWTIKNISLDDEVCQKHILYKSGWSNQTILKLGEYIQDSLEKKDKKMVSYYQALLQIMNVIAQYDQKTIYKDLFYIYYPVISLFIEQLNESREAIQKEEDVKKKQKKQRYMEKALSEFIDVNEILMSHMGHSCGDVLSNNRHGEMQYDIPIKLCFMYMAYLNIITDILNDCNDQEYQYCLSPLAYSRPSTEFFDFGVSTSKRVIKVQISRSMMFMPRPLLVILAHEASHYVGDELRNRKKRSECFLNIAIISITIYLFSDETLQKNNISSDDENIIFDSYWLQLGKKVQAYLGKALREKGKDTYRLPEYAHNAAEFWRDLFSDLNEIIDDNNEALKNEMFFIDEETQDKLIKPEYVANLYKRICNAQRGLQNRCVRILYLKELRDVLEEIYKNMREIYADLSAILLLELRPNDFLEAYIISEGCILDEDSITSDLLNRVGMVKHIIIKEEKENKVFRKQWENWKTEKEEEWSGSKFVDQLKNKADEYLNQFTAKSSKQKAGEETTNLFEKKGLFYCRQIIEYEEGYFTECYKSLKKHLKKSYKLKVDKNGKSKLEILKEFFGLFGVMKKGEDVSTKVFFKRYEELVSCYKSDISRKYENDLVKLR